MTKILDKIAINDAADIAASYPSNVEGIYLLLEKEMDIPRKDQFNSFLSFIKYLLQYAKLKDINNELNAEKVEEVLELIEDKYYNLSQEAADDWINALVKILWEIDAEIGDTLAEAFNQPGSKNDHLGS